MRPFEAGYMLVEVLEEIQVWDVRKPLSEADEVVAVDPQNTNDEDFAAKFVLQRKTVHTAAETASTKFRWCRIMNRTHISRVWVFRILSGLVK